MEMFRILIFLFLSIKIWAYVNITPLTFDKRIDGEGDIRNTHFQTQVKILLNIEYILKKIIKNMI